MRFDSNQAWKDAAQFVSANRDVLLALAGVFLALPTFALTLFLPPPEPPASSSLENAMALLGQYYAKVWPAILVAGLLSILGSLTMMTLFTDRSRPTVGEAITSGARSMPSVIGAQILFGLAGGLAITLVMGLAVASGSNGFRALAGLGLLLAFLYFVVRLSLVMPSVVVEGLRNPVAALKRSWDLTRGNVLHLIAFYVLLMVAFMVIYLIVAKGLGLIVALATTGATAAVINNVIAACLQAVLTVYTVAIQAATHHQLAGPSQAGLADKFE